MYLPMSLPLSPLLVGNMSLVVSGTALREEVACRRGAHVTLGRAGSWVGVCITVTLLF